MAAGSGVRPVSPPAVPDGAPALRGAPDGTPRLPVLSTLPGELLHGTR
ncbi:hypothetical protein [Kineococcus arenarius]